MEVPAPVVDPTPVPVVPVPVPTPPAPKPSKWDAVKVNVAVGASLLAVVVIAWHISRPTAPDIAPTPLPTPGISLKAPVGQMTAITLPAVNAGSQVQWFNPSPEKMQVKEYADHVMVCPQVIEKNLSLAATVFSGGQFAMVTWAIDSNKGPIPPPEPVPPGPTPIPPNPPEPPTPISPLQKSLQAAYDAESDPAKPQQLAKLATNLATIVDVNKATGKIKVEKDLQTAVKVCNDATIGPNALPKLRLAIGSYLVPILGTKENAPADAAFWAKASSEYAAVYQALKGVK